MNAGDRAAEAADSIGGTQALDIGKHPIEDTDLRHRGDKRGDDLNGEHDPRRDLHVMAELQIRGKLDALRRRDVTVGNENHVGDRSTGEDSAANELANQVNAAMLIRDGHDDTVGEEEKGTDG